MSSISNIEKIKQTIIKWKYAEAINLLNVISINDVNFYNINKLYAACYKGIGEHQTQMEYLLKIKDDLNFSKNDNIALANCYISLKNFNKGYEIFNNLLSSNSQDLLIRKHYTLNLIITEDLLQVLKIIEKIKINFCEDINLDNFLFETKNKILSIHSIDHQEEDTIFLFNKIYEEKEQKNIFYNFESIGCDCEFGLVQRNFNCDPISLFRWAGINVKNLVKIVKDNFKDLYYEKYYEIVGNENFEFMCCNTSYDLTIHTGVKNGEISKEKTISNIVKRNIYLSNYFLKETKTNKKIYVYKSNDIITDEEIEIIYEIMQSLGSNKILFVNKNSNFDSIFIESKFGLIANITNIIPNIKFDEWYNIIHYTYNYFNKDLNNHQSITADNNLSINIDERIWFH
jgi:tetratricopeptide (TPR) repeat protein